MASMFLRALRPYVLGSAIGWTLDSGLGFTFQGRVGGGLQAVALTDAASIVVDCSLGNFCTLTKAANGVAVVAAPTNLPADSTFWLKLMNTSGAPITNTTFAATYKLPTALTFPATAFNRTWQFWWDGTNAWLITEPAQDVAN